MRMHNHTHTHSVETAVINAGFSNCDPDRAPSDPPNRLLSELNEISHQPENEWPALSKPDIYVVRKMIHDRKSEDLSSAAGLTLLLLLLAGTFLFIVTGCTNYTHTHSYPDGSRDVTSFRDFLKKTDVNSLATAVDVSTATNGTSTYHRKVGVKALETSGDPDMLKAVSAGATEGALNFMKKSAPVPVP